MTYCRTQMKPLQFIIYLARYDSIISPPRFCVISIGLLFLFSLYLGDQSCNTFTEPLSVILDGVNPHLRYFSVQNKSFNVNS